MKNVCIYVVTDYIDYNTIQRGKQQYTGKQVKTYLDLLVQ